MDKTYKKLTKLISTNSITTEDVINKLFKLDQNTKNRKAAEKNIIFLKKPKIKKFLEKNKKTFPRYVKFLSLTEFHIGQRRANEKKDWIAKKYFIRAHKATTKYPGEWTSYVKATVLYMNGSKIPKILIKKSNPGNRPILKQFNLGLKQRGKPLYVEDYIKARK